MVTIKMERGAIVTYIVLQHVKVLGVVCCFEINTPICMGNTWEGDPRRYESITNPTVYIFSPRIWGWWVAMLSWNHYT
jgi:hypothetical protein